MNDTANRNNEQVKSYSNGQNGGQKTDIDKDITNLAWLLDDSITIFGRKIGIDAILGLIPGLGDWGSLLLGLYIVVRSAQHGASTQTLTRMLLNLGIDALVATVPVLGDLFDFVFKANSRNIKLLQTELDAATPPEPAKPKTVFAVIIAAIGLALLGLVGCIAVLIQFFHWIVTL